VQEEEGRGWDKAEKGKRKRREGKGREGKKGNSPWFAWSDKMHVRHHKRP
jgi:hypothetical protein